MNQCIRWVSGLLAGLCSSYLAAAPLYFNYTAEVTASDRPGAPTGSMLTGQFSYDPDAIRAQFGGDYRPQPASASLSAIGSNGFYLQRDLAVINLHSSATADAMTLQSFVSESPNDWHMVLDIYEPGNSWLHGDTSLPTSYPAFTNAPYLSVYFTDEYNWVRTLDATLLSITPASGPLTPVPVAPALVYMLSGLLLLAGVRRR